MATLHLGTDQPLRSVPTGWAWRWHNLQV